MPVRIDARSLVRRSSTLLLLLLPLLLSACSDDDAPPPAATATRTAVPTQTSPPSHTATSVPTATQTSVATSTHTAVPTATSTPTSTEAPTGTPTTAPPPFSAHGSLGQVYVLDAGEGSSVKLLDAEGGVVQTGAADAYGSFLFRKVEPGEGYRVVIDKGEGDETSDALRVTVVDEVPDPSFYSSQQLVNGYQYLTTRDGTKLAINVILPGPIGGSYPTVIEYSGYDPANPTNPQPTSRVASALGYAVVGINVRGSGCSGGAFDFFEPLQTTDGYDAVEIVAAQPWVKGHKVGMVGISYPGIAQLFVAQRQPPHLAAIAPLSVISSIGQGILYPGGILNNGFATQFAADRQRDAQPGGQPWSQARIDAGDQVCIANQKMRFQSAILMDQIAANPFYVEEVAGPLSPETFVDRIQVPVFLAGAFQDEQTGGYFANMLDRFTGTDKVHITVTNGNHIEPLGPAVFSRWLEFLDFYVAERKPVRPGVIDVLLAILNDATFQAPFLVLEPLRFTDVATYEEALAQFEAEPRVRVLFENGAGSTPGAPVPSFEHSFSAWPIPELVPTAWYFAADGKLETTPPVGEGHDSFVYDASNAQRTNYPGPFENVWRATVAWDWQPVEAGELVSFATEALDETLVMAGSGSVDLWVRASAADVDLQVTLSELRPDGKETYVQTGWLRASHRKVDAARSTELRPVQTHLEVDAAPLPEDEFAEARVELYPFTHVFRAGSRIRITVEAPGGDRAAWKFAALAADDITVDIGRSPATPSRLVLPVVPGIEAPAALPACNSLRGQPCR
jgi:uncharacterized protein